MSTQKLNESFMQTDEQKLKSLSTQKELLQLEVDLLYTELSLNKLENGFLKVRLKNQVLLRVLIFLTGLVAGLELSSLIHILRK